MSKVKLVTADSEVETCKWRNLQADLYSDWWNTGALSLTSEIWTWTVVREESEGEPPSRAAMTTLTAGRSGSNSAL